MMKHPLESAFDIDSGILEEDFTSIEIPDDPTLDTIIQLALAAYKDNAEVIAMVEPKQRIKYLEAGERYLNQAKDAIHKKEMIKLQKEKLEQMKKAKQSPQKTSTSDSTGEGEGLSRKEMFERLAVVKGGQR